MEFRTRKVVKPGDLNPRNTLFGGRLLEWVDEECMIYCSCQVGHTSLATKFIDEINFLSAAKQEDVVEIGVEVVSTGRTSITVRCEVRNKATQQMILAVDKIVFVSLNSKGRPIPHELARKRRGESRFWPLPRWRRQKPAAMGEDAA